MANPHNHRVSHRIRVDLVEADVDMAFSLVDDARAAYHQGNVAFACAALEDASKVMIDIEQRLATLDARRRGPFGPLLEELRKSLHAAQIECA